MGPPNTEVNPRGEEQRWFIAADEGRLIFQQCADCGAIPNYLRTVCPSCWSETLIDRSSTGRGVIYSFTTQHRPGGPEFADDVPYTLVLVDLDEGVRVLADLRRFDEGDVGVGLPVEALFDDRDGGHSILRFQPSNYVSAR